MKKIAPMLYREQEMELDDVVQGKWWFIWGGLRDSLRVALQELRFLRRDVGRTDQLEIENEQLKEKLSRSVEDGATLREQLRTAEEANSAVAGELLEANDAAAGLRRDLANLTEQTKTVSDELVKYQKKARDEDMGRGRAIVRLEQEKAGLQTELDKLRTSYGILSKEAHGLRGVSDRLAQTQARLTQVATERDRAVRERDQAVNEKGRFAAQAEQQAARAQQAETLLVQIANIVNGAAAGAQ